MPLFLGNINKHLAGISTLDSLDHSCKRLSSVIATGKKTWEYNSFVATALWLPILNAWRQNLQLDYYVKGIPAITLTADSSALTCIGNDYFFDEIFSRHFGAIGTTGDCLNAISISGNSKNIIKDLEMAKENGLFTIGLLGKDVGDMKLHCEESVDIDSNVTAPAQEAHVFNGRYDLWHR